MSSRPSSMGDGQREGEESSMQDQVWISHIQGITLEDDWLTITDLMGQRYRIDPKALEKE